MIVCQACGTENADESQFCDECGAKLTEFAAEFHPPDFQTRQIESPDFQAANVTSIGIPSIVEVLQAQDNTADQQEIARQKGVHAILMIERGASAGAEFSLTADESYIGRWDADNGIFPDVDLDSHDSEAKVSRRHARILHKNGNYGIEDLGSTNGTYINRGRRLIPGNPQVLKDGDEIIVGKTFLRLMINR